MEARVAALRQVYAAASQSHVFKFFETLSEVPTDNPRAPQQAPNPRGSWPMRLDAERRNARLHARRSRGSGRGVRQVQQEELVKQLEGIDVKRVNPTPQPY